MKIMTVWNESDEQLNVWKKIYDHQVQQHKEALVSTVDLFTLTDMSSLLQKVPDLGM